MLEFDINKEFLQRYIRSCISRCQNKAHAFVPLVFANNHEMKTLTNWDNGIMVMLNDKMCKTLNNDENSLFIEVI